MIVGDHNSRLMIKANIVPDIKKPIKTPDFGKNFYNTAGIKSA
jgi:hypothetical protein